MRVALLISSRGTSRNSRSRFNRSPKVPLAMNAGPSRKQAGSLRGDYRREGKKLSNGMIRAIRGRIRRSFWKGIFSMAKKVRWGILGAARIAVRKVIPGMQRGEWSEVAAIASRERRKAEDAAQALGIPKAYGSYEELLADSSIEAIYNPLPNHLHVPWTIKAAEAGKHVLCEKPIALSAQEAMSLLEVSQRTGVKIEEAFMVRAHPQWQGVLDIIASGRIGAVRSVSGYFSYNNRDPKNIRNIAEYGGGGLMDIGCYLIFVSRLVFGEEPTRVIALMEEDPQMKTDALTSGIL